MLLFSVLASAAAEPTNAAAKDAIRVESGWQHVGSFSRGGIDNISGRHKAVDGVDCLEASAPTELPSDLLKAIITDIPGNLAWSSADLKASVVLSQSGSTQDYYQVLNLPAPLSDRYWFLRGQTHTTGSTWEFSWERIDASADYPQPLADLLAAHQGAVEVTVNVGSWALIEGADGLTVRFRSCTDVGGSVPRWAGEKAGRLMLPNNIVDLLTEGQRQRAQ